ncbi:hypothetical protein HDA40_000555 [Hamadaea flava]|uniref:Uncharacterized protein n=1 Tax=Hamadaea flava TaxID=1742688 RepID=A0ABV8LYV2_9ACTN|nr:hypothetical protein [Hamadaea flava]MCP2322048.1 hypothetical protein [Hamadaea flava]
MELPVESPTDTIATEKVDDPTLAYAWIGALAAIMSLGGAWATGVGLRAWIPDYHLPPHPWRDLLVRFALVGMAMAPSVVAIVCGWHARRRGLVRALTPAAIGLLIGLFWLTTYAVAAASEVLAR